MLYEVITRRRCAASSAAPSTTSSRPSRTSAWWRGCTGRSGCSSWSGRTAPCAAAEILQAADRLEADLVVVGSHGKGGLHYAFLGSVAEKVLRKIHRPVLVVPLQP